MKPQIYWLLKWHKHYTTHTHTHTGARTHTHTQACTHTAKRKKKQRPHSKMLFNISKPENVPPYSKRTKTKLICHINQCKRAKLDLKIIALTPKPNNSVQFSHSVMSDSLWPHESQHTRPSCPPSTPGVYPNSCPSSQWCHPAISSSVILFSSCPQSLPASGSFPMSQLFARGGQSTEVSALASVFPKNTQDWSPLEWTGWISLQSKGLSRVFSNTTVQKHQFFSAQPSSQSNSHIHIWLLEKP